LRRFSGKGHELVTPVGDEAQKALHPIAILLQALHIPYPMEAANLDVTGERTMLMSGSPIGRLAPSERTLRNPDWKKTS
jgi:hypothetical protein